VNLLVSGDNERGKPLADAEGLPASITRLQQLLATARGYVEGVVVRGAGAFMGQGSRAFARVHVRAYHLDCLALVPPYHIINVASPSHPPPARHAPPQAGRVKADPAIGRHLADTLAAIPRLEPSDFERMFNEGIQDQLLVSYFANLVRTQVALAERLGTAALPLV
jgi:hypothetical protein